MDDREQDRLALLAQPTAHGKERLEALTENVRILRLLLAYQEGALTALDFVERVHGAVPDPLAE